VKKVLPVKKSERSQKLVVVRTGVKAGGRAKP
jgi:hypothetical protein